MTVRFTWLPEEWREAYLLSIGKQPVKRNGAMGLQVTISVALLGAWIDLAHGSRASLAIVSQESLAPVLLLVGMLGTVAAIWPLWLRRRNAVRGMPDRPEGEQQMVLYEAGWASSTDACGVLRGWGEVHGQRTGRYVLTLLTSDGSTVGLPLRVLDAELGGWLGRMVQRKLLRAAV